MISWWCSGELRPVTQSLSAACCCYSWVSRTGPEVPREVRPLRLSDQQEKEEDFNFLIKIFPWNTMTEPGDCGLQTPHIIRCHFSLPARFGGKNWGNVGSQLSKLTWLIVSPLPLHHYGFNFSHLKYLHQASFSPDLTHHPAYKKLKVESNNSVT